MRILVLSDNHHKKLDFNFNNYDYVIHCGDYGNSLEDLRNNNIYFVKGNCDFYGNNDNTFYIDNKKIYITHGNLYNVKYHYNNLIYRALEVEADICFFGHTHRQDLFIDNKILFINPGSYMDGCYIEINDDYILLYKNNELVKKTKYKW